MAEAEIIVPDFYIGDTETCGLQPHNYACQIGLMRIDPVSFDVLFEIESLIDPKYPIGEVASSIHGITDAMVADEPTLAEFLEIRLAGRFTSDVTMIAHNFKFDEKELRRVAPISRSICSLAEARQVKHLFPGLTDCKLQTLREYFGIKANDAHQALADCDTTRLVLKKICEVSGRTLEQMASTPDRLIHYMPFGKHEGQLIISLPKQYLAWAVDNLDVEKNLRDSLQKAYDLHR